MASLYDTFGQKYVEIHEEYVINGIAKSRFLFLIHATPSEEHSLTAKTTDHEIEDGSIISDHIINKGRKLTLEGIISDDNFSIASIGLTTAAGIVGNLFEGLASAVAIGAGSALADDISSGGEPSKNVLGILEYLYERKGTVQIITGLKSYTHMVMENLVIPRTPQNARSLTFKATFKEIKLVKFATILTTTETDNQGAVPQSNKGTKTPIDPSIDVQEKGSSAAIKIIGEERAQSWVDSVTEKGGAVVDWATEKWRRIFQ